MPDKQNQACVWKIIQMIIFLTRESSMYKTQSFKKKILVTAIASVAMSGFMAPAFAQEEDTEVFVPVWNVRWIRSAKLQVFRT
jgi:hypothetical protein